MPGTRLIKKLPSVEFLRQCFDYNPINGVLRWKVRPREHFPTEHGWKISNARCAGKRVTDIASRRYDYVCLGYEQYLRHRVIWKLVTGHDPLNTIDHIDRNQKNHRWANLRQATRSEQRCNTDLPKNTSGVRGVYPNGSGWRAVISFNKTQYHLGTYPTIEEASKAYRAAARKLHKQFFVNR